MMVNDGLVHDDSTMMNRSLDMFGLNSPDVVDFK